MTASRPDREQEIRARAEAAAVRLAQYGEPTKTWSTATYNDGTEKALHGIALALNAEVDRLRKELDRAENNLIGVNLACWEEEQDNNRLRLALKSAQRGRRDLRVRIAELEAAQHAAVAAAVATEEYPAVASPACEQGEAQLVAVADVAAWLSKKAREYDARPKSRRENPADWLDRLASKVERGAIRPGEQGGKERAVLTSTQYSAAWHAVEGTAGRDDADPGLVVNAVLDVLGISAPGSESDR
jgi:hypothetical protein